MAKRTWVDRYFKGTDGEVTISGNFRVEGSDLAKDEKIAVANHIAEQIMLAIKSAPYSYIPLSRVKIGHYPY